MTEPSEHGHRDDLMHRLIHEAIDAGSSVAARAELLVDHRLRWPDCDKYVVRRYGHLRVVN